MTSEFIRKAYSAIDNKKVMPFCFTRGLQNVFCFWESKSSDASKFTLNITLDSEVTCKLSTVNASEESWWHLCQFPQDYVSIFGLKPYIISVWDNESNKTLFWRNLTQEYVVYVEPPTKITVEEQKNPIGLLINFTNPETDQTLKDSIMYQVNYTSPKGDNSMTFNKDKVNSENGFVTLFLDDIKREAEYTIRVRAKADDPFDGYWSACAVTTYQTSNETQRKSALTSVPETEKFDDVIPLQDDNRDALALPTTECDSELQDPIALSREITSSTVNPPSEENTIDRSTAQMLSSAILKCTADLEKIKDHVCSVIQTLMDVVDTLAKV